MSDKLVRATSSEELSDGVAGLVAACEAGDIEVVKYLIEREGVDPEQAARDGNTPLHAAALKGHLEKVKYLIEKGASPVQPAFKDTHGTTPTHAASKGGNIEVLKHLIDKRGVNPEDKDKSGFTPLDHARNNKVRTLLIDRGARGSKSNRPRRSAATPSRCSQDENLSCQKAKKRRCTANPVGIMPKKILQDTLNLPKTAKALVPNSNTPQYIAVCNNWDHLVKAIKAIPEALQNLQRAFKAKSWLGRTAQTDADQLIILALNRIENNVKDYGVFMEMLSSVTGMDQIVDLVKGAMTSTTYDIDVPT